MHNKLLSKYYYISMETPAGAFYIVSDQNKIIATAFQKNWKELEKRLGVITNKEIKLLAEAKKQVNEYFKGQRKKFSLPYNMEGTAFQLKAWNALKKIPFGQTISYKAQATLINNPAACRAVGHANSLNPICLFIPCHRVIASNGKISGYAAGKNIKKLLLKHEQSLSVYK